MNVYIYILTNACLYLNMIRNFLFLIALKIIPLASTPLVTLLAIYIGPWGMLFDISSAPFRFQYVL